MQSYYESARDNARKPYAIYSEANRCLPHFHAGIELFYVLRGELTATMNGNTVKAGEGMLLINNCYTIHAYESTPDCLGIVVVIPLSIVPSVQKRLVNNRFGRETIHDDEKRSLEFMMRAVVDNAENDIMQKGMCYAILGYLSAHVGLEPVKNNDQTNIICRILNYLSDNYSSRLTVEDVAGRFGYSRSHFSHLFKSTIGYSLPQYLNILRCRNIGEELLRTDASVVELASNAGFNNPHTFYSSFKAYYHMTPREYVRLHKNGILPEDLPEEEEALS